MSDLPVASMESEVEKVFRKIFQKPDLQISRSMNTHDVPGWSSLLHVRIFVKLEEVFQIGFSPEEMVMIKNIGDLIDLVESKSKKVG